MFIFIDDNCKCNGLVINNFIIDSLRTREFLLLLKFVCDIFIFLNVITLCQDYYIWTY